MRAFCKTLWGPDADYKLHMSRDRRPRLHSRELSYAVCRESEKLIRHIG